MSRWECVVGVEVHLQLRTGRKLFCGDRAVFGAPPNTHVCPVCLGLPGALPVPCPDAVRLAIRTALMLGCTVHPVSIWARKHYFYPDLPKGYQITQFEKPLATDGAVDFDARSGHGTVRIRRVHMEEDAGKSVHDRVPSATAIDLNRAGTPLVEIVTEPDLRSAGDVRAFLGALKHRLEYADVSDCNMEEGSLRADANVSLRPVGDDTLGTKTEIKNVNSFSGIERALELEVRRQTELLEAGGRVEQQTLLWDDHRGRLRPMRSKEDSHDYRYFPDPDLPPLVVREQEVDDVRASLPHGPRERREQLRARWELSAYDAEVLTQLRETADYFEEVAVGCGDAKLAANWIMGPIRSLRNANREGAGPPPVPSAHLVELLELLAAGTVSDSVAKTVLDAVAAGEGSPRQVVESRGLRQVRDESTLEGWVDEALAEHPEEADRARGGEGKLVGFLVGRVMQRSGGKADPRRVNALIRERLTGSG